MSDVHPLLLLLLIPAAVNGIWFCLFRSPLIPHLTGFLLGTGALSENEFRLLLTVKGYHRILHVWGCGACQAMWAGISTYLGWCILGGAMTLGLDWFLAFLLGGFGAMPIFKLLQSAPYGTQVVADAAVPAPEKETVIRQRLARALTPEEQHIMGFFANAPCDFEDCDKLRAEYKQARLDAEATKCPPCEHSAIMRTYREKLRVRYGYSKTQVPDLLPELASSNPGAANEVAKSP